MKNKISLIILLIASLSIAKAQDVETESQYRINAAIAYDLSEKFTIQLNPEVRFDNSFNVSKYHIDTKLEYDLYDFITLEGAYRFVINPRETKETEYFNRFAFGLSVNHEIKRLGGELNIRYTNDADDFNYEYNFLRYSAKLKYDIPKCKLTPFVSVKAYHQLNDNAMYKMRYSGGLGYKINKHHRVSLEYKFDYYLREYLNKHIIGIGYKYKF